MKYNILTKYLTFSLLFILSSANQLWAYDGGKITDIYDGYNRDRWTLYPCVILFVVGFVALIFVKKKKDN